MAYMDTRQNADKLGLKFWDYVIQGNSTIISFWLLIFSEVYLIILLGYKPSVNVVLLEDIAAVLGVGIAASCMTYTHFTGLYV